MLPTAARRLQMYFRDLLDVQLMPGSMGGGRSARTVVAWRLARPLEAFAADAPAQGGTALSIEFVSPAVAAHVADLLSR
jgi:hypothetical protein